MIIEQIITMANKGVRLDFIAMERSLRATGCDVPIKIIPFDNSRFELPANSTWIEDDDAAFNAVKNSEAVAHCRKFAALTKKNAAFFDTDIIHLQNPVKWLQPYSPEWFVVADTEWNKARWTFTSETKSVYEKQSTLWLLDQFNSGFFAFGDAVVTAEEIAAFLSAASFRKLWSGGGPTPGEQSAINWLVNQSQRTVTNLCLPPYRIESTMALDYPQDYRSVLTKANAAPFIHYAGAGRNLDAPISELIFQHLNAEEAEEWKAEYWRKKNEKARRHHWPLWVRVLKKMVPALNPHFNIQWVSKQPG